MWNGSRESVDGSVDSSTGSSTIKTTLFSSATLFITLFMLTITAALVIAERLSNNFNGCNNNRSTGGGGIALLLSVPTLKLFNHVFNGTSPVSSYQTSGRVQVTANNNDVTMAFNAKLFSSVLAASLILPTYAANSNNKCSANSSNIIKDI
jgi:hypothetical protein